MPRGKQKKENKIKISRELETTRGTAHFEADLSENELLTLIDIALIELFEAGKIPFQVVDEETNVLQYHSQPVEKQ